MTNNFIAEYNELKNIRSAYDSAETEIERNAARGDFKAFKEQLAGRGSITYKLYPELNHCFVPAIYDDILKASKEYGVERHIGEEVIADIADFIYAQK